MKVLIVRLSALGDVVQGIPCLVALKKSFPTWQISWLVEEASAPILEGHPCLDKLFVVETAWRKKKDLSKPNYIQGLKHLLDLRKKIQKEKFDAAIDLQGLFKSGFLTWMSGAKRRIGHNKTREFAHFFLKEFVGDHPTFDPGFPLLQRYLEPAKYLGADISRPEYILPSSSNETVSNINMILEPLQKQRPFIALCPWSIWPSKNWPSDRWIQVSKQLSQNYQVLIVGGPADHSAAETICSQIPAAANLAGKISVRDLPELFRRCKIVVGPDSGPVHIANATGVPKILMLFGSTSWKRSGPLGKEHRTLSTNLSCQPCFERICPLQHLNCQNQITVEQVLDEVHALEKTF